MKLVIKSAVLVCLLVGLIPAFCDEDHDAKEKSSPSTKRPNDGDKKDASRSGEDCNVRPSDIADFANGEAYNFKSLVTFITDPVCLSTSRSISQQAMAQGVSFNSTPFKLDNFSKNYSKMTLEGTRQLEATLLNTVPSTLREHPMNTAELLPIVGQLSLLSPQASRVILTNVIEQELVAADDLLTNKSSGPKDIAKTMLRMGANEPLIASELAVNIEEKAFLAQAESLAKIFRSLAQAAQVEGALVPTFNLSASALNRGIQKGEKSYPLEDRKSIASSVFRAIASSTNNNPAMDAGTTDLNIALGTLLKGKKMDRELIKKVWKEALTVLSKTISQTSLAKTVGLSLTKEIVYLPKNDQDALIAAARNYPELSYAIQNRYLEALEDSWDRLHEGKLSIAAFNKERKKFYEPLAAKLLEFEMNLLDPIWLKEVLKRGHIPNDAIEKRFPRFVLSLLERREKASKIAVMEQSLEPTLTAMLENFAVLWTLSHAHLPALGRWVERYDEKEKPAETPELLRELSGD
jgi:hypothetical protein